jgi:hypothetical protein
MGSRPWNFGGMLSCGTIKIKAYICLSDGLDLLVPACLLMIFLGEFKDVFVHLVGFQSHEQQLNNKIVNPKKKMQGWN